MSAVSVSFFFKIHNLFFLNTYFYYIFENVPLAGCLEILRHQSLSHGPAVHVGLLRADRVRSNVQVSDASQLFNMCFSAFPVSTRIRAAFSAETA